MSFKYDPFGRRIYKSSSAGTSVFVYDGDNLIEETNSSGAVVARYSQTQNIDEPLAILRSASTSYYEADGLGSITSLSSGAGALAQTYTFDSFGKQTAYTGSLTNSFQYTGRESDPETGLYYYRARYYDPAAGRFLGEDSIGFDGGINFYNYVDNDPTDYEDPLGRRKYKCPVFGPCYRLPRQPTKTPACCHNRGVDFFNVSGSVGPIWGVTGSLSVDQRGNLYFGFGPEIGKSPTFVSGSFTGNWLNQYCSPTPQQVDKYLSGLNVTGIVAFGVAAQQGGWPGSGTATGLGVGSPQAGVGGTYSWNLGNVLNVLKNLANLVQ